MIILSLTTDKISLISSSTSALDVVASYVDRDQSTGVVGLADRKLTAISTGTTTDIVASPAATTTRNIRTLSIRNKGSASNDVTVQLNANGTLYELHKATLLQGENLQYIENIGFFKLTDNTRLERSFVMESDSTHATAATFADITGLTCSMKSGLVYGVLACLHHVNNASTTGSQFGYNIGAAPTQAQFSTIDTVTPSATAAALSAGSATARDTAFTAQTTGSTSIRLAIIAGYIKPSADGTFAMRATSEVTVASGLIVKAGSWMKIFRQNG